MLHGERSWSKNSTNHTNIDSLSYLICIIKISNGLNFSANRLHSLFWFWESTRIWCLISVQHIGSKFFLCSFTKILVTFDTTYHTQTRNAQCLLKSTDTDFLVWNPVAVRSLDLGLWGITLSKNSVQNWRKSKQKRSKSVKKGVPIYSEM